MPDFTYVRPHPDNLADGRPMAFGSKVKLSRSEIKANNRLIDAGALVPVKRNQRKTPSSTPSKNSEA